MALWLLGPDPAGNCCGCEGRTSPCDTCGEPSGGACEMFLSDCLSISSFFPSTIPDLNDFNDRTDSCYGSGHTFDVNDSRIVVPAATIGTSANVVSITYSSQLNVSTLQYLFSSSALYLGVNLAAGDSIAMNWAVSTTATFSSGGFPTCSDGSYFFPFLGVVYDSTGGPVWAGVPDITYCDEESGYINVNDGGGAGSFIGTDGYSMNFIASVDGVYYFVMFGGTPGAQGGDLIISSGSTISAQLSLSVPANRIPLPVVANVSGVGLVEKCPKMLLPPLTESTGDWYADQAAAQSAITNNVSNCVGYTTASSSFYTSFTATNGGTSLTIAFVVPAASSAQPFMGGWGSINALAGATLTFSFSISTSVGTASAIIQVYDQDGTQVANLSGTTSPLTYVTTYTGRHIVFLGAASNKPELDASITVTSSSALSVNQIQALYATTPLLDCPARLNCS